MSRYALMQDDNVVNVVEWDGEREYNPEGTLILLSEDNPAGPGWLYENDKFIPPIEDTIKGGD